MLFPFLWKRIMYNFSLICIANSVIQLGGITLIYITFPWENQKQTIKLVSFFINSSKILTWLWPRHLIWQKDSLITSVSPTTQSVHICTYVLITWEMTFVNTVFYLRSPSTMATNQVTLCCAYGVQNIFPWAKFPYFRREWDAPEYTNVIGNI